MTVKTGKSKGNPILFERARGSTAPVSGLNGNTPVFLEFDASDLISATRRIVPVSFHGGDEVFPGHRCAGHHQFSEHHGTDQGCMLCHPDGRPHDLDQSMRHGRVRAPHSARTHAALGLVRCL